MARYREFRALRPTCRPSSLSPSNIDARSDVYSAGVVLFEAATGRRPYPETGAVARHWRCRRLPRLRLCRCPVPTCRRIANAAIAGALQRDVEKRFQSARELEAALDGLAAAQAALSRPGRVAIAAAVLAAAVIGAIGCGHLKPALSKLTETHAVLAILPVDNPNWLTSAPNISARASRRR